MLTVLIGCLLIVLNLHAQNASSYTTQPDVQADTVSVLPDSLRGALPDTVPGLVTPPSPTAFILDVDQLAEIDHQEFSDFVRVMPGFYPLDRAGFASASRGLMMGLSPKTMVLKLRGRCLEDHLLGSPDLGWIPPEALSRVDLIPLPLEAASARVDAYLRSLQAVPPASRLAVRDGFYGLGNVDFDLAQKISPQTILNAGGRVTTYNGRLFHSAGYGLNLRGEVGFQLTPDLAGWAGVMQNRLNSGVAFTSMDHNRERYDADVTLGWKGLSGNLYGYSQKETYGSSNADHWQELGLNLGANRRWGSVQTVFGFQAAQARWRFKLGNWTRTTFGGSNANITWTPLTDLKAVAYLGLDVSDDFSPARHLGLRVEWPVISSLTLFAGATQHQEFPSRFETSAFFAPGTHFLPYDSTLYMFPAIPVVGNRSLRQETYTTAFAGVKSGAEALSGSLAAFWRREEDPISWKVQGDTIRAFNADLRENRGVLGWTILRPGLRLEFGATGSWLRLRDGERRLFPEVIAHAWGQYSQPLFQDHLLLRWRTWLDFWGKRSAPVPLGWHVLGDDVVLSSRISAHLLGVHLFWELRNITDLKYELVPGLQMMHREEVWGVAWNFRN
jgi:hypothetical protein